ncbi:LRR receptor-like serine/threonine-protein kinase EFR [Olea europaea var. sylvestris]|uniref:LRR receptor-like serine/threonine-protein kinase EFR n=1 Tax=Olea europaea var. sylvestris TaxID=158386 RepID=UPI000C1D5C29|nr:LRR receptor-like serine/threonine-protein kinase EFR [Olea europaea var. sylvestris]
MGKNVFFMLLAIVYLLINIVTSLNSSIDEYALLAFKSQITSDPNKIWAKNWSQGTSFCNWIGISCGRRHQRVRGLNLANMGLGGTIAKEIGEISFLRSLIISNNNFHGFIPNEIGKLSQLQEIEMQNNGLSGSIPPTFEFLENLLKLNISNYGLPRDIRNRIFNLTSLIEISFRSDRLSGSLPMDIFFNLPKLERLRISRNQMSGNIHPSLGSLLVTNTMEEVIGESEATLVVVSITHQYFWYSLICVDKHNNTGTIMHSNSGQIPESIFNLSMLQILSLSDNSISSNIPSSISNGLPNLERLLLGDNQLSGKIPPSVSNFSKLAKLDLHGNSFSGQVPMNIGNLHNLHFLHFGFNQLTKNPSVIELDFLISLQNCRQLMILGIENKPFHEILAKSLGNLSEYVESFTADYCGVKGIIPNEVGNMTNLIELGIGSNELIGTIRDTLSQLRKLQKLRLGVNKLRGQYLPTFAIWYICIILIWEIISFLNSCQSV